MFPFSLASDHCLTINMMQIYLFESRENLSKSSVNFDFRKWKFFVQACDHRNIIICVANKFKSRKEQFSLNLSRETRIYRLSLKKFKEAPRSSNTKGKFI